MISRLILILLLFASNLSAANAQKNISKSDMQYLLHVEDTIAALTEKIIEDIDMVGRMRSDSMLTRTLVRALKVPYSFNFGFDSTTTLTMAYPADSSFRIFTWQYETTDFNYRQKGVIQMNTSDGSLLLHPLFDASDYTEMPNDSVRTNTNWIGAIYYKIIQTTINNNKVYTLLGYDENAERSTKKWVEVLQFNAQQKPIFGGNFFEFDKRDSNWQASWQRFNIEYKKDGRAKLNYNEEQKLIVYDHLTSEQNDPEKKYTFIPDGDYEALQWKDGKWVHLPNAFPEQALVNGKKQNPEQNLSNEISEAELLEQSEKNATKKVEAKTIKKSKIVLPSTKRKG
jgi:hypothetical protein